MSSVTTTATAAPTAMLQQRRPRPSRKTKSDPFFDLPAAPSTIPSPAGNSQSASDGDSPQREEDSILVRAIMTPILFISFLLSLFLVNRKDLARRASNSSNSSSSTARSYFSPIAWLSPEPYQAQPEGTRSPRSDSMAAQQDDHSHTKNRPKRSESWFYHKKHRAMMRLELSDAFEMRRRVIVGLLLAAFLFLTVSCWSIRAIYRRWLA